jgi:hypothetical protein
LLAKVSKLNPVKRNTRSCILGMMRQQGTAGWSGMPGRLEPRMDTNGHE